MARLGSKLRQKCAKLDKNVKLLVMYLFCSSLFRIVELGERKGEEEKKMRITEYFSTK